MAKSFIPPQISLPPLLTLKPLSMVTTKERKPLPSNLSSPNPLETVLGYVPGVISVQHLILKLYIAMSARGSSKNKFSSSQLPMAILVLANLLATLLV